MPTAPSLTFRRIMSGSVQARFDAVNALSPAQCKNDCINKNGIVNKNDYKKGESMPVIVMASAKGGVGKTTCAIILAAGFARQGGKVTLFDCDPNQSLTRWASRNLPDNVTHGGHPGANEIVTAIRDADGDGRIVVVDLEGIASRTVSRAIAMADLVLVPMQATAIDAEIGSEALGLVREEEELMDRRIPHAVVLTRTSAAVMSRVQRSLETALSEAEVDVIKPALVQRQAFAELFRHGGDLESMAKDPEITTAGNVDRAVDNARDFVKAVYERLVR